MSEFGSLEVTPVNDEIVVEDSIPGKELCPDCGKLLSITAAGTLRKHKCVNNISAGGTPVKGTGGNSRAPRNRTPASVRNLSVAVLAAGVEYTAAASVSRWAGCEPREVPTDLGDNADVMIGPVLDALWPRLPRRAQRLIKSLADESDLILAALAWWEYGRGLKAWATARAAMNESRETSTRGYQNGEQVSESINGNGIQNPYGAFTPDSVSSAFV